MGGGTCVVQRQRGRDSGTRGDGRATVIISFRVDTESTNQLGRGLTPLDAEAGETTPNDLPLQLRAQLTVHELQGDVRM
jgi:hypothetical protein